MALDTLANRAPRRRAHECGVAFALRVLPADRAALLREILDSDVRHAEIADHLPDDLAAVHPDCALDSPAAFAIGRHRIGRCNCGTAG